MKVYKAIAAVMAEMAKHGIAKDRRNTQGSGYNFRGIDDVYNALAPLLSASGLVILPRMIGRTCEERQSKSGGSLFYVTVEAEFDLVSADDGSKHTIRTFGEAMDSGDKATNRPCPPLSSTPLFKRSASLPKATTTPTRTRRRLRRSRWQPRHE